jgi:hypothetical protein
MFSRNFTGMPWAFETASAFIGGPGWAAASSTLARTA